MEPEQFLKRLENAVRLREMHVAHWAAIDLRNWLRHGGSPPDDIRERLNEVTKTLRRHDIPVNRDDAVSTRRTILQISKLIKKQETVG